MSKTSSSWPVWLSDPTSIGFLHALDFWIGAVGFLITLATFIAGWRKLQKVQSTAEGAAEAVKLLKVRLAQYDASLDAADAMHLFQEVERFLTLGDWRATVKAMAGVRMAVIRMDASITSADPDIAKQLRRSSSQMNKHIGVIEKAINNVTEYPDDHLLRQTVRLGQETFVRAQRALEGKIE